MKKMPVPQFLMINGLTGGAGRRNLRVGYFMLQLRRGMAKKSPKSMGFL
jgi:hypothetical protein